MASFIYDNFEFMTELNEEDLYLFIKRFDLKDRNALNLREFFLAFAPNESEAQQALALKMSTLPKEISGLKELIDDEGRQLFEQLWHLHMLGEFIIESMRHKLIKNTQFDLQAQMELID